MPTSPNSTEKSDQKYYGGIIPKRKEAYTLTPTTPTVQEILDAVARKVEMARQNTPPLAQDLQIKTPEGSEWSYYTVGEDDEETNLSTPVREVKPPHEFPKKCASTIRRSSSSAFKEGAPSYGMQTPAKTPSIKVEPPTLTTTEE